VSLFYVLLIAAKGVLLMTFARIEENCVQNTKTLINVIITVYSTVNMSRTLDQLLSEPDEEDDVAQDDDRLKHLLNGLNDFEEDSDVRDLIEGLEVSDAGRIKLLETKTPDVEKYHASEMQPDVASDFYVSQNRRSDITDYFESALEGKHKDIHFTKTPEPNTQYGDLEWAADESAEAEASVSKPSDGDDDSNTPSSPTGKKLYEQYDYHELLEHINEIDELLNTSGTTTNPDRGDRYVH
jgi:hypothetical protein